MIIILTIVALAVVYMILGAPMLLVCLLAIAAGVVSAAFERE